MQPTNTSRFWSAIVAIIAVAIIAIALIFALRYAAPDSAPADVPAENKQPQNTKIRE